MLHGANFAASFFNNVVANIFGACIFVAMTHLEAPLLKPKPPAPTALGRYLQRTGITVTELANAVGVNKGTISRIAQGVSCSDKLAEKIKKATGLKRL